MDGYAVRLVDLQEQPYKLRLVGEVAAGALPDAVVQPGTCVRVLTGANVPPGADTVVMVEQTDEKDSTVTLRGPVRPGANILRQGEDAREGELLLGAGTTLGALQVAVCAAVGKAEVKVHRHPHVALLCTGQELRDITASVLPHELRDSNGPALAAALSVWGFAHVTRKAAPDDREVLTARLAKLAGEHDVILLTGGVSVGKYDFVAEAVENLGAVCHFHGVAMKPGKPLLYATLPGNRHIFGLPGNPLSAMTCFHEFALPALRRLSGFAPEACRPSLHVPLASPLVSKGGRVRFVLANLRWQGDGPRAWPVESQSSADLVAGGRADGVIVLSADERKVSAGAVVEFHPWRPLP
jgi:molybdenum cofactor synthesis domain-containing protein